MSPQDRYQALHNILSLPDDALINKTDLAMLMSMSCRGVEKLMRKSQVPPRYNMPNRLLRWRMADVRKWMRDRQDQAAGA